LWCAGAAWHVARGRRGERRAQARARSRAGQTRGPEGGERRRREERRKERKEEKRKEEKGKKKKIGKKKGKEGKKEIGKGERKEKKKEKGFRELREILGKLGGREKGILWGSPVLGVGVILGTAVMARRTGWRDRGVHGIPGEVADSGVGAARGERRWAVPAGFAARTPRVRVDVKQHLTPSTQQVEKLA
jgi:hypothetical protein